MIVRREQVEDAEAIRLVQLAAFGDHGSTVAELVEVLREEMSPSRGLSLVADEEGEIIGHVMFTTSLLDAPERLVEVKVLSPLGVSPAWQRRGVGAALVAAGIEAMVEQGVPVVFLEGDPNYYGRFGFGPGEEQGFRKPSLRIPDASFQALCLPAYEPWMTGTLVYSEIFWRLDAVGLRER